MYHLFLFFGFLLCLDTDVFAKLLSPVIEFGDIFSFEGTGFMIDPLFPWILNPNIWGSNVDYDFLVFKSSKL